MIRIHVSTEDLAQTRFAFSPLWETVESYRAILGPGRHALHLPWISWAREEVGRLKVVDSPALRAYLEDPAGSVERLAELLVRYHRRVLAPHWPRLHTLLEADVFKRARTLAFHGPEALFGGLHRSVGYRSGRRDYYRLSLCGEQLLDLFGELDDEGPQG